MKKYLLLLPLLMLAIPSYAQTVADVADGMIPQIKNIAPVIEIVSYLCGIVCGIKAALKFKESNESRGQVKISAAIIFAVAAALFLALPTFVNTGIEFMGFDTAGQFKY
jgi:hypothetical protein